MTTNASAPLHITNAKKTFADRTIFSNLSLTINPEEIFGLIGLNGAGKTTLIKSILDLITPDEGTISLFGTPHTNPHARKHLYYLPEKFQPSHLLKAYEFLKFSLAYYGIPLDKQRMEQTALDLALDPQVLHWTIRKYSKGMVQKLGLLSVLLAERPLLILDEPMSGLDPSARSQLKTQMRNYRDAGNTVFFSSHILADIDELCDRIAVLHHGTLQFVGTPADFKAKHGQKSSSLEDTFLKAIAA